MRVLAALANGASLLLLLRGGLWKEGGGRCGGGLGGLARDLLGLLEIGLELVIVFQGRGPDIHMFGTEELINLGHLLLEALGVLLANGREGRRKLAR